MMEKLDAGILIQLNEFLCAGAGARSTRDRERLERELSTEQPAGSSSFELST
tara:strand:- start:2579 stop:2734 length:156 start_codon:yes stop_codon:yes gene_type:complete